MNSKHKQYHHTRQTLHLVMGIKDPTATPEYQESLRPKKRKVIQITKTGKKTV